jgi:hypothetical protein
MSSDLRLFGRLPCFVILPVRHMSLRPGSGPMKSRTATDGVRASLLPARLPDPANFLGPRAPRAFLPAAPDSEEP